MNWGGRFSGCQVATYENKKFNHDGHKGHEDGAVGFTSTERRRELAEQSEGQKDRRGRKIEEQRLRREIGTHIGTDLH